MITYRRSGRAVVWNRMSSTPGSGDNIPTIEDILEAANQEFPNCCLADLQIFSCGDSILMEEKVI